MGKIEFGLSVVLVPFLLFLAGVFLSSKKFQVLYRSSQNVLRSLQDVLAFLGSRTLDWYIVVVDFWFFCASSFCPCGSFCKL